MSLLSVVYERFAPWYSKVIEDEKRSRRMTNILASEKAINEAKALLDYKPTDHINRRTSP